MSSDRFQFGNTFQRCAPLSFRSRGRFQSNRGRAGGQAPFQRPRFLNPYNPLARPPGYANSTPFISNQQHQQQRVRIVDTRFSQRDTEEEEKGDSEVVQASINNPSQPHNAPVEQTYSIDRKPDAHNLFTAEEAALYMPITEPLDPSSIKEIPTERRQKSTVHEENPYFCKNCYKSYIDRLLYIRHLQQHVQCSFSGCPFQGSPHVVVKHHQNVHILASYALSSTAWLNERKRKFPTAQALQEKQMQEKERLSRGAVLTSENRFGKFRVTESAAFSRARASVANDGAKKPVFESLKGNEKSSGSSDCTGKAAMSSCENAESSTEQPITVVDVEAVVKDLCPEDAPDKIKKLLLEAYNSGDGGLKNNQSKVPYWKRKRSLFPPMQREGSTLLEKLLQDEIRRERNILLQCIQFIFENNFFDSNNNSQPQQEQIVLPMVADTVKVERI